MSLDWRFFYAPTYVYWAFEDCPMPNGFKAFMLMPKIKKTLEDIGYCGHVEARGVGDVCSEVDHGGLWVLDVPPGRVSQRMILRLLNRNRLRNKPLNLLLILGDISGDLEIQDALRFLKSAGFCNILLSQPKEVSGKVPPECYNSGFVWETLAAGPPGMPHDITYPSSEEDSDDEPSSDPGQSSVGPTSGACARLNNRRRATRRKSGREIWYSHRICVEK